MEYYHLPLYILFGILPSLIWLFYYLQKDIHPEPKKMILKIFLYGSLITVPVFFIQTGLADILRQLQALAFFATYPIVIEVIKWFLVIALTEEIFKYLIVKVNVLHSYALDEPLDIMLYMVVAALGFAAVENILYLFSPINGTSFNLFLRTTFTVSFIRFIGATFLHTLCSGLLGYFLALSSIKNKKGPALTIIGILLATVLHGLYNFSIITLWVPLNFIIPTIIILGLFIFMMYDFDEIKKIKSICKL